MKTSDTTAKLAEALAAFQAEVTNPFNTAANPHFRSRYVPLHDLLNHVRPLLAKHGLAVVQGTTGTDGRAGVVTMLLHKSGEFVETGSLLLKDRKDDAQGAGSALTYARRYSLCAILGVAGEDDDDANEASRRPASRPQASKQPAAKPKTPEPEKLPWGDHEAKAKLLARLADAAKAKDDLKVNRTVEQIRKYEWTPEDHAELVKAWRTAKKSTVPQDEGFDGLPEEAWNA